MAQVIKELAGPLPTAGHKAVRMICPISRRIIDYVDRGYFMPNRQILSCKLVDELKVPHGELFKFTHPITGQFVLTGSWLASTFLKALKGVY